VLLAGLVPLLFPSCRVQEMFRLISTLESRDDLFMFHLLSRLPPSYSIVVETVVPIGRVFKRYLETLFH
jgi:hypothetical protein